MRGISLALLAMGLAGAAQAERFDCRLYSACEGQRLCKAQVVVASVQVDLARMAGRAVETRLMVNGDQLDATATHGEGDVLQVAADRYVLTLAGEAARLQAADRDFEGTCLEVGS